MSLHQQNSPYHPYTSPWTQACEMFCQEDSSQSATMAHDEEFAPTHDALEDVYNPPVGADISKRV